MHPVGGEDGVVGEHGELPALCEKPDIAAQPEPPARLAGTGRVVAEAEAFDAEGEFVLDRLDRLDGGEIPLHPGAAGVAPVPAPGRAGSPGRVLVEDPVPPAAPGGDVGVVRPSLEFAHHKIGGDSGERPHQGVGQVGQHLGHPAAGGGQLRVDQCSFRGADGEGPERPRVDGPARVEEGFQNHERRGGSPRGAEVDRAFDLGSRAGEVGLHLVPPDGDFGAEPDGDVRSAAVVQVVLELARAVLQGADAVAHPRLGPVEQAHRRRIHDGAPVAPGEREHLALGGEEGGLHGAVVSPPLVLHPHVGEKNLERFAVLRAPAPYPDGRDPDPLLVNLDRLPADAAGPHPAHVRPVGPQPGEVGELSACE